MELVPKTLKWRVVLIVAAIAVFATPAAVIASHQFTDVVDGNVFHDDIAWLADAGVTKGCNPPTNDMFCPGANVTRQQMAAFMRRFAQYLGAEDGIVDAADHADHAAEAANADTVDGSHANEIVRVAAQSNFANVDDWDGTEIEDTVTIEVPARGQLVILYTTNLGRDNSGGGTGIQLYSLQPRLDGVLLGDFEDLFEIDFDGANDTTESLQRVITVDPGTYDVSVALAQSGAPTVDTTFIYDRSLTVLFVPFDGGGATPESLTTANKTADSNSNN